MKEKARVRLIYLDPKLDGSKVGLDDFLAAGNGITALLAKATTTLRPGPGPEHEFPYKETPHGLLWLKPTKDGAIPTPLCNFTARIIADVVEDDGVETRRLFEVEVVQGERRAAVKVSAERFASIAWATEALGARAILAPGQSVRDHVRVAVQVLSPDIKERRVYTHLGWRKINDAWKYLHVGGAIGIDGVVTGVEVHIPDALQRYVFPDPPSGQELIDTIHASLRVLTVAPGSIIAPIYASLWRAVLGASDFSLHLAGPTGQGKTELAALIQQHFGPELDARHLPASWSSTGNSLEGLAFVAKDAVLVVDDFAPSGSTNDVQRFHREADRLLRAQGNSAGRQRMRSDATLRAAKPPRGLIFSTGEDVPRGQSLRARLLVREVSPGTVNWETMSLCQKEAAEGAYARAMSAYLCWLAGRYEDIRAGLKDEVYKLRAEASVGDGHKRTPSIVADLAIGLRYFLRFVGETGALTSAEVERLWKDSWQALLEAGREQEQHQAASDPARRFIELLTAAIVSGRAHVASHDGSEPAEPEAWGWRKKTVGTGENQREEMQPRS